MNENEPTPLPLDSFLLGRVQRGELFPFAWTGLDGEPVLMLVPTEFPAETRGAAIRGIGKEIPLNDLALVSLLRTKGDRTVAANLLRAGWSPHEGFAVPLTPKESLRAECERTLTVGPNPHLVKNV